MLEVWMRARTSSEEPSALEAPVGSEASPVLEAPAGPEAPPVLEAPAGQEASPLFSSGQTSIGHENQAELTALLAAFCFFRTDIHWP